MANICENKYYITCDNSETLNAIATKLDQMFEDRLDLDGEITYLDESFLEGYFDSKWSFPDHIFENFFDEFTDDTIYMRCLSTEYGCQYVAMNIYRDKRWEKEQSFDL